MSDEQMYGSDADGAKNAEYCGYCFKDGAFTQDCTMDEMIAVCVPHMVSANPSMTEDAARQTMTEFFPTLKRWR
jgi:hypothetical protein